MCNNNYTCPPTDTVVHGRKNNNTIISNKTSIHNKIIIYIIRVHWISRKDDL